MPEAPTSFPDGCERLSPPSGRGRLCAYRRFPSRYLEARDLFIWLPDAAERGERLPVIYMQDGQNLFDARLVPFGVAWEADRSVSRLNDIGLFPPAIVVGVACTANRLAEYAPELILRRLPPRSRDIIETAWPDAPRSADYARMLIEEVKPFVDASFPTLPTGDATYAAGASMGGVMAAELLARHPRVFAGAACLSAHFSLLPVNETAIQPGYFASDVAKAVGDFALACMPRAGRHRIWLDRSEFGVDRFYGPSHKAFADALSALGYVEGVDMSSRLFVGVGHDEAAWRQRLDDALLFLIPKP